MHETKEGFAEYFFHFMVGKGMYRISRITGTNSSKSTCTLFRIYYLQHTTLPLHFMNFLSKCDALEYFYADFAENFPTGSWLFGQSVLRYGVRMCCGIPQNSYKPPSEARYDPLSLHE